MKKKVIILLLSTVAPFWSVWGQNAQLMNWYKDINKLSSTLRDKEIVSLKKEVLYDGSIIPVAPGMFIYYSGNDCPDTIPFLYSYGRIAMEKDKFNRMVNIVPDSTKLIVRMAFQPRRTSMSQKVNAGDNVISFYTTKHGLTDLYLNRNEVINLNSYYAITTLKNCYKVVYMDYSTGGFYYHIPSEEKRRKSIMNKLDSLFSKQYHEGYNLLNFF